MLNDNTTVTGSWVNITDMAKDSNTHQRIVNEVTMAMPHSGVVAAASDKLNDITQPRDVSVCIRDHSSIPRVLLVFLRSRSIREHKNVFALVYHFCHSSFLLKNKQKRL